VKPGTIRIFSIPAKTKIAKRTSRSWTARKSVARETRGRRRAAAKEKP
jgi:hypothetical protein